MSDATQPASMPLGLIARSLQSERPVTPPHWTERLVDQAVGFIVAHSAALRARRLRRILPVVQFASAGLQASSDADLRREAAGLAVHLRRDGGLQDCALVGRTFALIREVSNRQLGMRHFDVQLMGGYALLSGMIAEMATGEGKTLTAILAAATAALAGLPVHVVTVNDYLAERDANLMRPVYEALGLRVGLARHGQSPEERRDAYRADVTYATNKELAFDYLRDRIALRRQHGQLRLRVRNLADAQGADGTAGLLLRGLHFAIIDEADSIFIDEARTPLIISGPALSDERIEMTETALKLASAMEAGRDYTLSHDRRAANLTRSGRSRLVTLAPADDWYWENEVLREEMVRLALAALHLFHRGEAYIIDDGKVQIVDEFTGRIMADRTWSEGLHQLIEFKEGVELTRPRDPLARITYQRFFRRYHRLSGMTGTAAEVAREMWTVFRLPVVRIPTNRPSRRIVLPDTVFPDARAKWHAIAERCRELNAIGRPVLVGTRSVAASEAASLALREAGLDHSVLNAVQDENEAAIIAEAGLPGRITVATNMAGRGTDIHISPEVDKIGGLHVIMSERHEAGRIDRQLAGRCGRQGGQGSFDAMLALDDPLVVQSSDLRTMLRLAGTLSGFRHAPALWVFRLAQRRSERSHRRMRLRLLRQDEQLGNLLSFTGKLE